MAWWLASAHGDSHCRNIRCAAACSSAPPLSARPDLQARGQLPALFAALLVAAAVLATAALWLMRRRRAQYLLDFYAFSPPQRCIPVLQRCWRSHGMRCRLQAAGHLACAAEPHGRTSTVADGTWLPRRMAVFKETYMKGVCAPLTTL